MELHYHKNDELICYIDVLMRVYNILYYTKSVFVSTMWVNEPRSLARSLIWKIRSRSFVYLSIYIRRIMKRVNFYRSIFWSWLDLSEAYLFVHGCVFGRRFLKNSEHAVKC